MKRGDGADVVEFVQAYGRITKDSVAGLSGAPLNPRSWQRSLVAATFARTPDGRRRHRIAMWGMARKNGKTGLVAPIALYGLLAEGEGAQVLSCAADRDQAKLLFGDAKRTVEMSPELMGLCRLYRDVIEVRSTGSVYRALSSEAYTKEGLSPTLVVYDELHAAPNRELFDVMALAMGARVDPLMLIVTTAGVRTDTTGQDSVAYRLYQHGVRVATGEIADPTFFFAWWEPRQSDAPLGDPVAAAEGNPGLGDILDPADLTAAANPGRMPASEYLTKRRNQWVNSQTAWLPTGAFEARAVPQIPDPRQPDKLIPSRRLRPKETVVLGFDGSFNHDCTALVAVTLDGFVSVLNLWERPQYAVDWEVPVDEVDAAVLAACGEYTVKDIACDPFRWRREIQGWVAAGLPAFEFATSSPARMVPACAIFYDAVMNGRLTHSGDPALVRHVNNCIVKIDRLGPRIVKDNLASPRSIDLAVAAVAAYARATYHASIPEPPKRAGAFLV